MSSIEFKVEYDAPSPEKLAGFLAEAYQTASIYQNQFEAYELQARLEQQKIDNLKEILVKIENMEDRSQISTSRMDPYKTYDIGAIKTQLTQHQNDVIKFKEEATRFKIKAEEARKEIQRLHAELSKLK